MTARDFCWISEKQRGYSVSDDQDLLLLNKSLKDRGFEVALSMDSEIPKDYVDFMYTMGAYLVFCKNNSIEPRDISPVKIGNYYMINLLHVYPKGVPIPIMLAENQFRITDQGDVKFFVLEKIDEFKLLVSDEFLLQVKYDDLIKSVNSHSRLVVTQKTYVMVDNSTGLYKIGKSKNPSLREKTLQSEKPAIELLFSIDTDIEHSLHEEFKDRRVRGEWFSLDQLDFDYLKSMMLKNEK